MLEVQLRTPRSTTSICTYATLNPPNLGRARFSIGEGVGAALTTAARTVEMMAKLENRIVEMSICFFFDEFGGVCGRKRKRERREMDVNYTRRDQR
jgi:hypothetical protein